MVYQISTNPEDIKAGLAPESYGDKKTSCQGYDETTPIVTPTTRQSRGLSVSQYPTAPKLTLSSYRSASARGWGSGWPKCTSRLSTITGGDIRITVRTEIAELVQTLLNYADTKLGYTLIKGQTGGFNCRNISGTSIASNHSWGLALDINWQKNPFSRVFTCDLPPALVSAFWKCGFYWGGWYRNMAYDPMHFEYIGTPSTVSKHLGYAKRFLASETVISVIDTNEFKGVRVGSRLIQAGCQGTDVVWLQKKLGVKADGFMGPVTLAALIAYQKRNLLDADGVAGPVTIKQLRKPGISLRALAKAYQLRGSNPEPCQDTIRLQKALTARGYPCQPDGYFARLTRKALSEYRSALSTRADANQADISGSPAGWSLTHLGFSVKP